MKHNPQYIDIEIDKLTNSIENVITGEGFQTDISLIGAKDLTSVTKKNGLLFIGDLKDTFHLLQKPC